MLPTWAESRFLLATKVASRVHFVLTMAPKRKVSGDSDGRSEKTKKNKDMPGPSILADNWFSESKKKIFVGAHVSISGGFENALMEAASIGGQAVACFLCNQRTFNVKPLEDDAATRFREKAKQLGYPGHLILPHASYLLNLGSPEPAALSRSRSLFLDGLKRCEKLGIQVYNFHPGSTLGKITPQKCCENIAESINYVHAHTNNVIAVIENMSKQGNTVGGDFKELKQIIDKVKDKSRVGVCFDTCHAFAAGYDLRSDVAFQKTWEEFENTVGLKYLKGIHLNDSKSDLGSHLDRHELIGKGKLGLKVFKRIMNDERFQNIPIVLETPGDLSIWKKEIALLYSQFD